MNTVDDLVSRVLSVVLGLKESKVAAAFVKMSSWTIRCRQYSTWVPVEPNGERHERQTKTSKPIAPDFADIQRRFNDGDSEGPKEGPRSGLWGVLAESSGEPDANAEQREVQRQDSIQQRPSWLGTQHLDNEP